MARVITITTPATRSDSVIADLRELQGLLHLTNTARRIDRTAGRRDQRRRTNRRLNELMRVLDHHGLGLSDGLSMSSSAPASYVPTKDHDRIERDSNQAARSRMGSNGNDDR